MLNVEFEMEVLKLEMTSAEYQKPRRLWGVLGSREIVKFNISLLMAGGIEVAHPDRNHPNLLLSQLARARAAGRQHAQK